MEIETEAPELDLSDLIARTWHDLPIVKPGSEVRTGWIIRLAGPAHHQTIAAQNELARENLEREKAIEFAQFNGQRWKPDEETVDQRRRRNVEGVCRRIISWSPDPTFRFFSEQPVAFSLATAVDLFLRREMAPFLLQITNYLGSERAFMPPSSQA